MGKLKSALTVAVLVAATGGALLLGAGNASAQGTPTPWVPGGVNPDANAVGGLTFYNAAGDAITSGPIGTSPLAAFIQGKVNTRTATDTTATIFAYTPNPAQTPDQWTENTQISGTVIPYPNAAAPGALATSTLPVASGGSTDTPLSTHIAAFPASTTPATYTNLYELRMYTNHHLGVQSVTYDYADISVNTTAGTWSLVYTPGQGLTQTVLTAPATSFSGTPVTLSAQIYPIGEAGSVQFSDNAGPVGAAVPVSTTTGIATKSDTFTNAGPGNITENLSAVFTPTDTTYNTSTGTATSTVSPPVPATNTALAVSGGNTTALTDSTLTATVTPTGAVGTVSFTDNGVAIPGLTQTSSTGDVFVYDDPAGFAVGSHSVIATFTPTNPANWQPSTSPAANFTTQGATTPSCQATGSSCTDIQNIEATVPAGTLVITTPYTSTSPLNLGTMTLGVDPASHVLQFNAQAPFANIVVVDTRSGGAGWTVQAQSSDLADGTGHTNGVIDSQNVGLTGVTGAGSAGFAGTVTYTQNPSANPAVAPGTPLGAVGDQGLGLVPHTIGATPTLGTGTYTFNGDLSLNAPTSTEANLYTGTITFTVG